MIPKSGYPAVPYSHLGVNPAQRSTQMNRIQPALQRGAPVIRPAPVAAHGGYPVRSPVARVAAPLSVQPSVQLSTPSKPESVKAEKVESGTAEEKGAPEPAPKKEADLVESNSSAPVDAGTSEQAPEKSTDSVEDAKKEDEGTEAPEQKVIALQAMVIRQDPKMLFCPNFLNDEEIEHVLELARERWRESTVGTGYGYSDDLKMINKQSRTRTSWSAELDCGQTPMIRDIEHRIAGFAKFPRSHVERLNPLRYQPGQKFDEHHDGGFRPKTVFIYLNDLEEDDEGETYFPYIGIKIKPLKGAAILWPNVDKDGNADMNMRHMGLPPKKNTKYGMNCFINMRPINEGF